MIPIKYRTNNDGNKIITLRTSPPTGIVSVCCTCCCGGCGPIHQAVFEELGVTSLSYAATFSGVVSSTGGTTVSKDGVLSYSPCSASSFSNTCNGLFTVCEYTYVALTISKDTSGACVVYMNAALTNAFGGGVFVNFSCGGSKIVPVSQLIGTHTLTAGNNFNAPSCAVTLTIS
jgi:hypothetical protein